MPVILPCPCISYTSVPGNMYIYISCSEQGNRPRRIMWDSPNIIIRPVDGGANIKFADTPSKTIAQSTWSDLRLLDTVGTTPNKCRGMTVLLACQCV